MALRRFFGFSDGELMRSDSKPCSRLTRQTAGIFTVGGGLAFWILCRLHYGLSYIFCCFFSACLFILCSLILNALLCCLI
jgi:hypothetical protein